MSARQLWFEASAFGMGRAVIAILAAVPIVTSCHRSPSGSESSASGSASARGSEGPLPVAPRELLIEGAVGSPAETWKRLRAIVGGPALRVPSTLSLAITTLIGASPLVAGLVDDAAPVALAVLDDEGKPALVAGLRLTSGPEFVAALVNGADARFEAALDQEHAVTVLTLKRPASGARHGGAASEDVAVGVARNVLLIGGAQKELRTVAAYMARTLAPSLQRGDTLTLVARKSALVGSFSSLVRLGLGNALGGLAAAARASREAHGRAADFGDPDAVLGALTQLADEGAAVLESAAEVRLSAALFGAVPELSVEIAAEGTGRASALARTLPVGDLSPVLGLPADTEMAFSWRRAPLGEDAGVRGWAAVLGDRLRPADRKRLSGWMADLDDGLGPFAMTGLLSGRAEPALFVVSPEGDALSGRRAFDAIPALLQIPALARPLEAFVGPLGITTEGGTVPGIGARADLHVRRRAGSRGEAIAVDLSLSSSAGQVAMVAGGASAPGRLAELLTPVPALGIGSDVVVARAVNRARKGASAAGFFRVRDGSSQRGWAALTVGSDRRALRVDLTASDVAARALLRAALAP